MEVQLPRLRVLSNSLYKGKGKQVLGAQFNGDCTSRLGVEASKTEMPAGGKRQLESIR